MTIKLQDVVSKVTIHSDTPEEIGKAILDWVEKTGPIVVYKSSTFKNGDKNDS